ncbi:MAG: restriction endonuclease [Planctomycetes bacterium]|nr:restriction endonuclease [Planctomycetota bacterium]
MMPEERNELPPGVASSRGDFGLASLMEHWKRRSRGRAIEIRVADHIGLSDAASAQTISPVGIPSEEAFGTPGVRSPSERAEDTEPGTGTGSLGEELASSPEVLLQATIVNLGDRTNDGHLIIAVAIPWLAILREIERDPDFLFRFATNPRKFEEFIAGAYHRAGWPQVELTPRSNDGGRDVIATKPGFGSIRFLDQVKAYSPGTLVTHNDVRAMLGVLQTDVNASKGLITTTSDFQPGILSSDEFKRFLPHRLELKNGRQLRGWLMSIADAPEIDTIIAEPFIESDSEHRGRSGRSGRS